MHAELLKMRNAKPFVPFSVLMVDGGRLEIERPWYVFDEERIVFIRVKNRSSHLTVRFQNIVSIQPIGSAEAA